MGKRVGTKRLSAGAEGDHTCLLRADGNIVCWGNNASGQIGDGSSGNIRDVPAPVSGITTAVSVAVGSNHSCALLATGSVKCWGSNATGQLGVGQATAASSLPLTVPNLTSVVSLAAGTGFTCARKSDGTVRCWGANQLGQLGDATLTSPRFTPVQVSNLNDAVAIVAGATHTCALRGGGSMVCWGGNDQGQLGVGHTTNRNIPTAVVGITEVVEMAAGLRFTCAVRARGAMHCWGDNDLGQFATGTASNNSTLPVASVITFGAIDIVAGQTHACLISADPRLACWGGNDKGQLGIGSTSAFEPRHEIVDGERPLEAAAGRRHGCVLAANDVVRCWGDDTLGQLGNTSSTTPVVAPGSVLGLSGSVSARSLGAGTNHSCAVRAEGGAACWGRNDGGQIGDGTTIDRLVPTAVGTALLQGGAFVTIVGGGDHSCALTDVVGFAPACWGDNRNQEVDPFQDRDFALSPSLVFVGRNKRVISAGSFHTCGLNDLYAVACWGRNENEQLADADVNLEFNENIGGFENGLATAAAGGHSCALLANGKIFCWGSNGFGQLGDGTRNDSATPREVAGIGNAIALSSTRDHNCALLATGIVVCWGRNDFGQADGTLGGDRLAATPVASLAAGVAVGVTTGFQHSCVLTAAGRVRCWGRNNNGQLGNNTLNDSLAPVEVLRATKTPVALDDVIGLVSDAEHNCALLTTGQPVCWGRNPEGQLGDGTRTRRLMAFGVGSFTANIARNAQLRSPGRIAEVTVLVNCPDGERFSGNIQITQASVTARHPLTGACTGGLSEYPLGVPVQGRDGFAPGEALADIAIVVHSRGEVTDEQQWTRRILLAGDP